MRGITIGIGVSHGSVISMLIDQLSIRKLQTKWAHRLLTIGVFGVFQS